MLGKPVRVSLALYLRDQGVRTGQPERRIPRQAQIGRMFGTPLIQPHDRRTQDAAGRVETDDRRPLRGERDRGGVLRFDFHATTTRLAAIDTCTPRAFGILFGPARLRLFNVFCEGLPRRVNQLTPFSPTPLSTVFSYL